MNMQEAYDCIYTRPFAEDDFLLNDYVKDMLHRISWNLFERQEDICYMINEKNPPQLKEEALDVIQEEINRELSWLGHYMLMHILIAYRFSNIDLDVNSEWYIQDEFGKEDWNDFVDAVTKAIWKDYAKMLGEEEAIKYFKRINRPEFIKAGEDTE